MGFNSGFKGLTRGFQPAALESCAVFADDEISRMCTLSLAFDQEFSRYVGVNLVTFHQ